MKQKNAKVDTVVYVKSLAMGEFHSPSFARHIGVITGTVTHFSSDQFPVFVTFPNVKDPSAPSSDWFRPEDLRRLRPPAVGDVFHAGHLMVMLKDYAGLHAGEIVTVTNGVHVRNLSYTSTVTSKTGEDIQVPTRLLADHPNQGE